MVTINNSPVAPGSTVAQAQAYIPPSVTGVTIQNTDTIEKLKNLPSANILLSTANTWTATQTFPVASFANLLSTANTWSESQTFSAETTFSAGTNTFVYYSGTSDNNINIIYNSPSNGQGDYGNIVESFQENGNTTMTITNSFPSGNLGSLVITNVNHVPKLNIFTLTALGTMKSLNNTLDDGSGDMSIAGSLSLATSQTTITGTTAGSAIASMPFQGSSYKKVIVYLDGYENDSTTAQTYKFPVAFTYTPSTTNNSASVPGVTVSTTELSLAPDTTTAYTGWIIIEGY